MIDEQELLVKQFKTEATDKAVESCLKKWAQIKLLPNLDKQKKC